MKKKILFGLIVALLVAGTGYMVYYGTRGYADRGITSTSEPTTTPRKRPTGVAYLNKDATLSEVTRKDGVVNIYMFWGDGCPHCKKQWEFLESIRKQYPNDFAVYGFEVWYNRDNRLLLDKFTTAIGSSEADAVPYTFIGSKVVSGFGSEETTGKEILNMIQEEKNSGVDVYFDKVKSTL